MNSSTSDKEGNIKKMFDSIAFRYDFLNHLTSFGVDKIWRKKAMGMISSRIPGSVILDVATGTADLAIEASKYNPSSIKGIDVSDKMLEIGRLKLLKKGVQDKIELFLAASEDIPFETNSFDIVISVLGVRNFDDLESGLMEMNRVLKIGGKSAYTGCFQTPLFCAKSYLQVLFYKNTALGGKGSFKRQRCLQLSSKVGDGVPRRQRFFKGFDKNGLFRCCPKTSYFRDSVGLYRG